jgi:hypothetical protein
VSYAFASGLQAGIFARLAGDATLAQLIDDRIHDAPLALAPGDTEYVTIGEESVRDFATKTSDGAIHDFTVTAHSGRDGFDGVKRVAAAVCAALVDAPLALASGRLVALRFLRASAERGRPPVKRRVVLRFRAVVDED